MEQIKPIEGRAVYTPPTRSSQPASTDSASKPAKEVAPQFVSPKGNIDPQSGVFVTEVRDTGTGKVTFQYPSKKAVAAYTQSEKAQQAPEQSNANEGQAEGKPKVESSASADAVTDGTTGQGDGET